MQVSLPGQIQGHLAARIANRGVSAYRRAFTSISRTPSRRSGSICRSHWRGLPAPLFSGEPSQSAPGGTLTLEACRYTALRPRKLERTLDVVVTGDSAGS
jgi:hypothetical protein